MTSLIQTVKESIMYYKDCEKKAEKISDLRDASYCNGVAEGLKIALAHIEVHKLIRKINNG
jgi:hypothetical protein